MITNKILLIGYNEREIDFWDKQLFEYKEVVSIHITGEQQTVGYYDTHYMLVGQWEKNPRIKEILYYLKMHGCEEIELLEEDSNVL